MHQAAIKRSFFHPARRSAIGLYGSVLLLALSLSSCVRQVYYVSPFNGNHSSYHPIPSKADSLRSGYYASAAISYGSANDQESDDVFLVRTALSGGHTFGLFQAFYAATLATGYYKADSVGGIINTGKKPFGGAGFEGGVNVVIPFDGGEWRLIGVEASWHSEWGNYLRFRQGLPPGVADLVIKNNAFSTIGGYSELIINTPVFPLGFRCAAGTALGRDYRSLNLYDENKQRWLRYRYLNLTGHATYHRYTGYLQLNLATKASGALLGVAYHFRK